MKNINYIIICFAIFLSCIEQSCSKDDGPGGDSRVVGSWYGIHSYYNPAGGTKYQYLTLTFDSDGTGNMEYESPVSYSAAKFFYKVDGNRVYCEGAYADTYGDIADDFTMTLRIENDRLIPENRYSMFILTRDGSVVTDGNGNEIKNPGDSDEDDGGSSNNDDSNIRKLIKENVSVSVSYKDYDWIFYIESKLNNVLSGHTIKYGIGHGVLSDYTENVTVGTQSHSYVENNRGDVVEVNIVSPFWYYYIWGVEPQDLEIFTKCEMFYKSYRNLQNQSSLMDYEIENMNELKKYLSQYESKMKWIYKPSVQVEIDGKFYMYDRYRLN